MERDFDDDMGPATAIAVAVFLGACLYVLSFLMMLQEG